MANFTNDLICGMLPMTSTILGRSHLVIIVVMMQLQVKEN